MLVLCFISKIKTCFNKEVGEGWGKEGLSLLFLYVSNNVSTLRQRLDQHRASLGCRLFRGAVHYVFTWL
jgi:hypothetical protein